MKSKKKLGPLIGGLCILCMAFLFFPGCQRVKATEHGIEPDSAMVEIGPDESELSISDLDLDLIEEAAFYEAVPVLWEEPRYALSAPSARPGEPLTVGFMDVPSGAARRNLQAILFDSRGRRITRASFFEVTGELKAAIMAVPSTAIAGNSVVRVEAGGEKLRELPFVIERRDFFSETIPLDQSNTDLRTVPDPQKTAESELLWAIISRTGTIIYSDGLFIPPVESRRITSSYGSRRVYEYANGTSDTTIHAGIDIGVPTGTPVLSCAAGKVALARYRIVTGYTVIVEHLPGVFSLYYHMDSIAVTEGQLVEAGALLGESGATGLATGPHLHWEIRVSTENADPDVFLSRPVLDKNDIIDKMFNTQ